MLVQFIKPHGDNKPGDTKELPRDEAYKLSRGGYVVFKIQKQPETASIEPQAERAVMPKPRRSKPKAK